MLERLDLKNKLPKTEYNEIMDDLGLRLGLVQRKAKSSIISLYSVLGSLFFKSNLSNIPSPYFPPKDYLKFLAIGF